MTLLSDLRTRSGLSSHPHGANLGMVRGRVVSAEMEGDDHGGAEEQDRRCLE